MATLAAWDIAFALLSSVETSEQRHSESSGVDPRLPLPLLLLPPRSVMCCSVVGLRGLLPGLPLLVHLQRLVLVGLAHPGALPACAQKATVRNLRKANLCLATNKHCHVQLRPPMLQYKKVAAKNCLGHGLPFGHIPESRACRG